MNGQTVGKAVGVLVGILWLLLSIAVLFVPVYWAAGSGGVARMSAVEYLSGNVSAESIYLRAMLLLLFSISLIYIVMSEGIRVLWLITAVLAISGIGSSLHYTGNTWKIMLVTAVLLAASASLLTIGDRFSTEAG